MDVFSGAITLPLVGAVLHPLLGAMVQQATRSGVRMSIVLGSANLLTLAVFTAWLRPDFGGPFSMIDWLALLNGFLFFWGQWFSLQSVRKGDLVVHSSALGFKVLIVAALSASVGLEKAGPSLVGGSLLAALAVYLVTGATADRWKANRATLGLTLLACVFFATNDFLTGWKSRDVDAARWLILMMLAAGTLSLAMLVSRWGDVKAMLATPNMAWPTLGAGFTLGVQALLVNIAFSRFGEPTLSNIAYSTRGVMAVIFVWAITKRAGSVFGWRQLLGATLMVGALALVLM